MSLETINVAPGFMPYMPKEYRDLVLDGPYGRQVKVLSGFCRRMISFPMSLLVQSKVEIF